MTIAQFKKWLNDKIEFLQGLQEFGFEDDYTYAQVFIDEAYDYAIDLQLPEAADACRKGPMTIRLLECLNAIPEPESDYLTPPKIANQLNVSPDTVRGWINNKQLVAFNVAKPGKRPRWKVRCEDLESFLAERQPEKKPEKTRKPKLLVQKY